MNSENLKLDHAQVFFSQTLFTVICNLEPGKEADFCRVGAMCQLNLEVLPSESKTLDDVSLMYEVIADSTMWAVCGRAAGKLIKK